MSTIAIEPNEHLDRYEVDTDPYRVAALFGLVLLTAASVRVLYEITTILGGTLQLLGRIAFALVLAFAAAKYLKPRVAVALFGGLVLISYLWYFATVADDLWLLIEAPAMVIAHTINDSMMIATGESVLAIGATDTWALSFAPAPLFLMWYFGFRGRYGAAGGFGGAVMLLFVFSGDLNWWWTLVGTIGIVATIGFGRFEHTRASRRYVEGLLVLIAAMTLVALVVPLVPGGGAFGPLTIVDADSDTAAPSLESSVVGAGDELEIIGEINLDPEVRYTIEQDESVYMRTGIYDKYTGSGWERTGDAQPFVERETLPQNNQLQRQHVRTEVNTDRLPHANHPLSVIGVDGVMETEHGDLLVNGTIPAGEQFTVFSAIPLRPADPSEATVPETFDERYTQLPEETPQRLHEFTDELIADTNGPIEAADRIASFLRQEKDYSHNVTVPEGDIADAFLFEMEAGYCTYFATTMVSMLRSADIPSRMAVGYAGGQAIDEDTSVVRGLNSHAWVEVYVEGYGWMDFEPTPPASRMDLRGEVVDEAREEGLEGIDINESAELPFDYDPTETDEGAEGDDPDEPPVTDPTDPQDPGQPGFDEIHHPEGAHAWFDPGSTVEIEGDYPELEQFAGDDPDTPEEESTPLSDALSWEHLLVAGIISVGAVLGMRRYDVPARVRRQTRLRWHLRSSAPVDDLHRSAERLEWALELRYRPRRPGETLRQYHRLYSIVDEDPAVTALFEHVERARYAGQIDRELADEAIDLADEIIDDTVFLGGRYRPSMPWARSSDLADRIL